VQKYLHNILQFTVFSFIILLPSLAGNVFLIISLKMYPSNSISIFTLWHCKSRTSSRFLYDMQSASENWLKAELMICKIWYVTEQLAHNVPKNV
jgi:hypothetical protein